MGMIEEGEAMIPFLFLQLHIQLFFAIVFMKKTTSSNPDKRSAAEWEEWWREMMPGGVFDKVQSVDDLLLLIPLALVVMEALLLGVYYIFIAVMEGVRMLRR